MGNTVLLLGLLALLFHLAKALGIAAPSWNLAQAEVTRLRGVLGPACRPAPGKKGEKEEPPDAKDADGVEELLQQGEGAGGKEGKPPSGASGQELKGEKGDTAGPSPGPKGEFPRKWPQSIPASKSLSWRGTHRAGEGEDFSVLPGTPPPDNREVRAVEDSWRVVLDT